MEYQLKKKQILEGVEYTNLLTFALTENKLERNFKSIVDALMLTQAETQQTKEHLATVQESHSNQLKELNQKISELEGKILSQKGSKRSVRTSLLKEKNNIEEQQNSSENKISEPNLVVNLAQSAPNTQLDIDQVISSSGSKKQNENMYNQLLKEINQLKENQANSKELQKDIEGMKENINSVKAQLLAVNQMNDRKKQSDRRISLRNANEALFTNKQNTNQSSSANHEKSAKNTNDNMSNQLQEELAFLKNQFDREINSLHVEINTLQLNFEEIKEQNIEAKKKDSKNGIQIEDLQKSLKKLQSQIELDNEGFERELKNIKNELLNRDSTGNSGNVADMRSSNESFEKKSRKNIEINNVKEVNPNYNAQINDKLSRIQGALQQMVTQTEFKRFKNNMADNIENLQKQNQNTKKDLKEEVQMLTELIDQKDQQINNLQKQIDELKELNKESSGQCERRNNISLSKVEELKKGLQQLKQDLEFYKSMNQMMTENEAKEAVVQEAATQQKEVGKTVAANSQTEQNLKKYFSRKLHDQRAYLLGQIRDLEKKNNSKNNLERDILNLWDKLAEINLFLGKKANEDDIRKSLGFLEKKLSSLAAKIMSNDENSEDARIARTNWFCLSCDKNLSNYQGKVGKHVPWDSMPIKGEHSKFYQDKKVLPLLKK